MALEWLKQELLHFLDEPEKTEKMTWDSFQQILSDTLDEDIISYARQSGKLYIGGKCTVFGEVSENVFNKKTDLVMEAKLYFKEQFSKEAEIRTITRRCSYDLFTEDERTTAMLKQALHETFEFEVAVPEIKENGKE